MAQEITLDYYQDIYSRHTHMYIYIYIYICFSSHDKGVFFSVFDCWVLCVFRGKNMWRRGFLNLQFIVQTG